MTDDDEIRVGVAARRLAAGEPVGSDERRLVGERVLDLERAIAEATRLLAEKEKARRFNQRVSNAWKARSEYHRAEAKALRHQLAQASGHTTRETT